MRRLVLCVCVCVRSWNDACDDSMCCNMCRFYFRNWHGLNEKEPMVSRYTSQTGSEHGAAPLLEITSLEYLFAQVSFCRLRDSPEVLLSHHPNTRIKILKCFNVTWHRQSVIL